MPKLTKNEINLLDDETEEIEMNGTVYEMTPQPNNPVKFGFNRVNKYDYPEVEDTDENGKPFMREMTQDEKSKLRRKSRNNARRAAEGKPINPNQNRVKMSDSEKAFKRSNRRQIRNSIKYLAIEELAQLEKYAGMTPDEIYLSLRDTLTH